VNRELSNMATEEGVDPEEIKIAMIEKSGPLYTQALDRVGKMQGVKQFASVFWLDFFPEGEQQQRKLKLAFEKAAAANNLGAFFDAHPEYEARLMLNQLDKRRTCCACSPAPPFGTAGTS